MEEILWWTFLVIFCAAETVATWLSRRLVKAYKEGIKIRDERIEEQEELIKTMRGLAEIDLQLIDAYRRAFEERGMQ